MSPIAPAPIPDTAKAILSPLIRPTGQVTWGRRTEARRGDHAMAVSIVVLSPIWMNVNWAALHHFQGSLFDTLLALRSRGLFQFARSFFPRPSAAAGFAYAAWILWQLLLYRFGPGKKSDGQCTPGGHTLHYTANGLFAWALTHFIFLAAILSGHLDPLLIPRHWGPLVMIANAYGFLLAAVAQSKGYLAPSFPADSKRSGSWAFDFFSGIELNPRVGQNLDLKFFHLGRPGLIAWTMINFSWAAYQYHSYGHVTYSMLIVNVLQAVYVVDFFCNEAWYTRTFDVAHDHFGFYLAWGSVSFVPQFYTLHTQFLAQHPVELGPLRAAATLSAGLLGYAIFRSANNQKYDVRQLKGNARVWGCQAEFIRSTYQSADGKEHQNLLLTCGWWGICRHTNYLADMIQVFAICSACGFDHILPWTHFAFMCILFYTRLLRDERRCRNKYGIQWDEYCKKVPFRLIPGLW